MKQYKFKTILELNKTFNTELKCIKYLEYLKWGKNNENIKSPFDLTSKLYKCKNYQYRCKNTKKIFNEFNNILVNMLNYKNIKDTEIKKNSL